MYIEQFDAIFSAFAQLHIRFRYLILQLLI